MKDDAAQGEVVGPLTFSLSSESVCLLPDNCHFLLFLDYLAATWGCLAIFSLAWCAVRGRTHNNFTGLFYLSCGLCVASLAFLLSASPAAVGMLEWHSCQDGMKFLLKWNSAGFLASFCRLPQPLLEYLNGILMEWDGILVGMEFYLLFCFLSVTFLGGWGGLCV